MSDHVRFFLYHPQRRLTLDHCLLEQSRVHYPPMDRVHARHQDPGHHKGVSWMSQARCSTYTTFTRLLAAKHLTAPEYTLTSAASIDVTNTMGRLNTCLWCVGQPLCTAQMSCSIKTLVCTSHISLLKPLCFGSPSHVGAGTSILFPSWIKN